jgi:hypothetical protein
LYVQNLKIARQIICSEPNQNLTIVISEDGRPRTQHRRRYNRQLSKEVAVIMPNEMRGTNRDIVIRYRNGNLQRINELNHAYDALQYPIFLPHGNSSYHIDLRDENGKKNQYYELLCLSFDGSNQPQLSSLWC